MKLKDLEEKNRYGAQKNTTTFFNVKDLETFNSILKSASFKALKQIDPDAKINFLAFTNRVAMYYLKAAKVRRQLPQNIIYPRKRSWKGKAAVPEN